MRTLSKIFSIALLSVFAFQVTALTLHVSQHSLKDLALQAETSYQESSKILNDLHSESDCQLCSTFHSNLFSILNAPSLISQPYPWISVFTLSGSDLFNRLSIAPEARGPPHLFV